MMRYLPHTSEDVAAMLATVGAESLEGLFPTVPADSRLTEALDLPASLTEWELNGHMSALAAEMAVYPEYKVFLGAGSYDHFIPESVKYLSGRSEFLTAYTPYQPEISQGTLQAIYEYQTLVCRLMGMEVANASMYDGASALAEALLMAVRIAKRKKVAVSTAVHPLYRRVIRTYLDPAGCEIVEIPWRESGLSELAAIDAMDGLAAVALQSPNFFGCIEDLKTGSEKAHAQKALLVASFNEPLAYGLYKNPGSLGADIACGEGQSFGIPRTFGGPALGMFASRMKYVRNMPGRLVGQTADKDGQRGFVLTLSTREQHIRRAKATSNICSNEGHCALTAVMYMASLGETGLRDLARLNFDKAEYLKKELTRAGFKSPFSATTFNEFTVEFPKGFEGTYNRLLEKKIVAGLPLAPYYPELSRCYLLCITETATKKDLDNLVKEVTA